MERLRGSARIDPRIDRRKFIKVALEAGAGALGGILSGCAWGLRHYGDTPSDYKPEEYTIKLPGANRYETVLKEFEGAAPIILTLRPPLSENPWVVNSAILDFLGNFPYVGRMEILTEVDHRTRDQDQKWQGFFLIPTAGQEGRELRVGRIVAGRAPEVITTIRRLEYYKRLSDLDKLGRRILGPPHLHLPQGLEPPANLDSLAIMVEFDSLDRRDKPTKLIRNSETMPVLALWQVTPDGQPIKDSRLLFHIQPSSLPK